MKYTYDELMDALRKYEENRPLTRELDRQRLIEVLKDFPNLSYNFTDN